MYVGVDLTLWWQKRYMNVTLRFSNFITLKSSSGVSQVEKILRGSDFYGIR